MKRTWMVMTAVLAAAVLGAACGGGGSSQADQAKKALAALGVNASTTTVAGAPVGNTQGPHGPAIGKIRVANLVMVDGKPGPSMDLYDTSRPAPGIAPLISNLAYGQVSDYVTPHGYVEGDTTSNLYAYPAGTLNKTQLLNGSNIDNAGFAADDQLTIALFAGEGGYGLGSGDIEEAGKRGQNDPDMQTPPTSGGKLIARSVIQDENTSGGYQYLTINGTCPPPTNIDGVSKTLPTSVGGDDVFPVKAGTVQLGTLTSPPGSALMTCTGKKPLNTTSTSVSDGQRVVVLVYGDPKSPSLVTAPVQG